MNESIASATTSLEPSDLSTRMAIEKRIAGQPLIPGNRVSLLVDGEQTYDAMFTAIRRAEQVIMIETYLLQDDLVGKTLAELLIKQASVGVDVYLIYDGFGSYFTDDAYFDRLKEAGVRAEAFNVPNWRHFKRSHVRDHRKILIVDCLIGFIGGINFTQSYTSNTLARRIQTNRLPNFNWRDTHLQIEGPAVHALQAQFLKQWQHIIEQRDGASIDPPYCPWHEQEPPGESMVRIIATEGEVREQASRSSIVDSYIAAIDAATDRVWMTQAYLVPGDGLIRSLCEAAGRGVDVRLVVPNKTDFRIIIYATRHLYRRLIKAGIRIHEYLPCMLHAKTAVIDHAWCTIGSSNLDYRSLLDNHEANVTVIDTDLARELEQTFLDDLETCEPITAETVHGWSRWTRFRHAVAFRLRRWL